MLGLGSGIYMGSPTLKLNLLGTYTSDFTSDVDGWAAASVEGTLNLEAGENAPGYSGNDWLKGTFDTNQTNPSDLKKLNVFSVEAGDYWQVSWKIYLDNPGGGDFWDNNFDSGTTHRTVAILGNIGSGTQFDTPQEEVYSAASSIIGPVTTTGPSNDQAYIRLTSTVDLPLAGAVFYIKDIVWKHYRYTL